MIHLAERVRIPNSQPLRIDDVPVLEYDIFSDLLAEEMSQPTAEISALFGVPHNSQSLRIYAITSQAASGEFLLMATDVGDRYPALTPRITQAHWFEREIAEQWGAVPEGDP